MLVLERRLNERILIGPEIEVCVVRFTGPGKVRLGITAPGHLLITRPKTKSKTEHHNGRKRRWQP